MQYAVPSSTPHGIFSRAGSANACQPFAIRPGAVRLDVLVSTSQLLRNSARPLSALTVGVTGRREIYEPALPDILRLVNFRPEYILSP